ncbi:MAG: hypothetical protein RIC89_15080 [Pseudomonadales bacterium]
MSSNRFNKILIVDSVPSGETPTAQNLYDAIEREIGNDSGSPFPELIRIESADQFLQLLSDSTIHAESNDVYPMLHIECHGDEDGFEFADGSLLDWPEMKIPLTTLNQAMRLNLMVAVAACSGAAIAKLLSMDDRAPFWGMVGPDQTVMPSQLEGPFKSLYLTLIRTKSPETAIEEFGKAAGNLYWHTTAQDLFERCWSGYKEKYCTPEALQKRGARMHSKAPQLSIEECIERLLANEPMDFERFRTTFFMCDLYPDHNDRFPVEYH